ncbi:hypothetical protein GCM10017559_56360 [Streptosporangium longisporum]|uniref:Uncharacterized protein n=1 Tax=Streptosporangium longisporum TaxID=46187 RepID=A0ABN3Y9V6_9ACTN
MEGPVDVGEREGRDARPAGQVDGRGLGGVQRGHRPGGGLRGADAERRGQRVPDGESGTAFVVGHMAHRAMVPQPDPGGGHNETTEFRNLAVSELAGIVPLVRGGDP